MTTRIRVLNDGASITDDDELTRFLRAFLATAPVIGHVPLENAVWNIDQVISVLLYRKDQFQVQQFIVPPDYVIPAHVHPNVDSYEVFVGGSIRFTHSGVVVLDTDVDRRVDQYGSSIHRGAVIRVKPNDRHGGYFGMAGGVFLSVQQWQHGVKPHCVSLDYTGRVVGTDHLNKVAAGAPQPANQRELREEDAL